MKWDPEQYLAYSDLRLRPAVELLAHLPDGRYETVCDLGCGAGNVTALMAERWPEAVLTGVDSSPEMLEKAKAVAPSAEFIVANVVDWQPETPLDLIFSNAALHWLDDHDRLFPRLLGLLNPGGVLAVQMPRNHGEASHRAMIETVEDGPWTAALRPLVRAQPVATPDVYYALLAPAAASVDIWETVYLQQLEGENPVVEWTKGTALRPFLDALERDAQAAFEAAYGARILRAYPPASGGRTLFPFRRLFMVAQKH